jgi:hypothetical protein
MKLKAKDLRRIIKEEFSSTIPDFMLRQMAEKCSEDLKRLMINHIKVKSPADRTYMIALANKVSEDLEEEVKKLLDEKLSEFLNRSSH